MKSVVLQELQIVNYSLCVKAVTQLHTKQVMDNLTLFSVLGGIKNRGNTCFFNACVQALLPLQNVSGKFG